MRNLLTLIAWGLMAIAFGLSIGILGLKPTLSIYFLTASTALYSVLLFKDK